MYIPNFGLLAAFGGELGEEQHFFEFKNRGKLYLSSELTWGVDFWIRYTTFDFLSIDLKKGKLYVFDSSALSPSNCGITEF